MTFLKAIPTESAVKVQAIVMQASMKREARGMAADLVNSNPVHVIHLVKLINAHHTSVSQNHGSSLQLPITCTVK